MTSNFETHKNVGDNFLLHVISRYILYSPKESSLKERPKWVPLFESTLLLILFILKFSPPYGGPISGRFIRWMDGWMGGWVGGWMGVFTSKKIFGPKFRV